ncbi:hypothetical protein XCY_001860 [Xanthomonas arboricola pv. juglandis]|uniref:AP2 domain-containing protein n=1 Tax=Xanthomonas arboricola TaxID=56448 RepID=UPI001AF7BBB6|nr:AP2 domain-containing protein [Xanthomonas arboricola]CAG2089192.1 hypothetical protein XCY_001860 [Xanthomonas arboricola pv. juglandis]
MPELIKLTNGGFALVDEEDVSRVSSRDWRKMRDKDKVYAVSGSGENLVLMHRLLASPKAHQLVDHRNGVGLNNTRRNLRVCDHAENSWNRRPRADSESGYKGVTALHRSGGGVRWLAEITIRGERKRLGTFGTAKAAAEAYKKASIKSHGDFSYFIARASLSSR